MHAENAHHHKSAKLHEHLASLNKAYEIFH